MKEYKKALTIAGFDNSGGAGIQADLKTFSALGCYGMSILTSLPIQNTTGVKSIYEIPTEVIEDQLITLLEDIDVKVIKIGMLHNLEIICKIANILNDKFTIILDPVMVATSGDRLLGKTAIETLKKLILPMSTVITPNLPEASELLKKTIKSKREMEIAAKELAELGPNNVILKGGHMTGEFSEDCFFIKETGNIKWFKSKRIKTKNLHGTGCTFSAAIAAYLANGNDIENAVDKAKKYIYNAIKFGAEYEIGKGNGPVHHFYNIWDK